MIYITGDIHGELEFERLVNFKNNHPNLTRSDYVIILGDCGIVWSDKTLQKRLDMYKELPFTVLFVDGNHENFELLNKFPKELWHKGYIHRISENVIHLMRGEIFEIEGLTFLAFGGADSTDKALRIQNIDWWEEESPSYEEMDNAAENLNKYNFKVDYILTHTIDERALYMPNMIKKYYKTYPSNKILNYFEENVKYNHWYFGHYHDDLNITKNKTMLYQTFIKIK